MSSFNLLGSLILMLNSLHNTFLSETGNENKPVFIFPLEKQFCHGRLEIETQVSSSKASFLHNDCVKYVFPNT